MQREEFGDPCFRILGHEAGRDIATFYRDGCRIMRDLRRHSDPNYILIERIERIKVKPLRPVFASLT